MKYSVIMTTNRGFDDFKYLFEVSSSDAEIIVVDSNFNENTKERIRTTSHSYCKITYAPPRSEKIYKRDFLLGLNTALAYVEGDWVVKLDDSTEIKPDFFDVVDEDLVKLKKYYGDERFVLRPVKLEGWQKDKKWDTHRLLRGEVHRYIGLGRKGIGGVYFITLDQGVYSRDSIDLLNGYDERYDCGHGYDDNDIFHRFLSLGYKIVMDQKLMTYQYKHDIKKDYIGFSKLIFDINMIEVSRGKYYVWNLFDLREFRPKMLVKKKEYVL